ncbi:hypothetical protein [Enterococcus faecalis]|uniref:hypothetical protein n=1 Tax=Enterococcus faecalis TaxID=1351 RepID=UPI0027DEF10F|nr:hypothetical protein [Enterococcus faecalis]MDQ6109947.1 hypothetical protein [Enterococcus faecalis]MDQ6225939.1 hypothetical protein [Enterococcus faecalis]
MTKEINELSVENINNVVGIDLEVIFLATSYDSHFLQRTQSQTQIRSVQSCP